MGVVDASSVVVEGQFGLDMMSLGMVDSEVVDHDMVDIGLMCSGMLD